MSELSIKTTEESGIIADGQIMEGMTQRLNLRSQPITNTAVGLINTKEMEVYIETRSFHKPSFLKWKLSNQNKK